MNDIISRRTDGHRVLRHLETVRHDFFTPPSHTPMRARSRGLLRFVPFAYFCISRKGLDADAKK